MPDVYNHVDVELEVAYRGETVTPKVKVTSDPNSQRDYQSVTLHGQDAMRQFFSAVEKIKRQAILHGLYTEED